MLPKTGPKCVKAALDFAQQDGEFAENTFGLMGSADGPYDAAQLTDIANALITWMGTGDGAGHSYQAELSDNYELISVTVKDLSVVDGAIVVAAASVVGSKASDAEQQGVAAAITARTGLSGRSFRGRTFILGLTDASVVDASHPNQLASGYATNMSDAFNALPGVGGSPAISSGGTDFVMAVLSYRNAGADRANILPTPITSYGFHDLLTDFQRRRAPGHNRHH